MKKAAKAINLCSTVLSNISSVTFVIVLLSVVINVIIRRLFSVTIGGIIEIVEYGMLVTTVLAMAKTTYGGGHVSVSILTERVPPRARACIHFAAMLLSAALLAVAAYVCIANIPPTMLSNRRTNHYKIPYYLVYVVMSFGLILSCLTFLFKGLAAIFPFDEDKENGSDAE